MMYAEAFKWVLEDLTLVCVGCESPNQWWWGLLRRRRWTGTWDTEEAWHASAEATAAKATDVRQRVQGPKHERTVSDDLILFGPANCTSTGPLRLAHTLCSSSAEVQHLSQHSPRFALYLANEKIMKKIIWRYLFSHYKAHGKGKS